MAISTLSSDSLHVCLGASDYGVYIISDHYDATQRLESGA